MGNNIWQLKRSVTHIDYITDTRYNSQLSNPEKSRPLTKSTWVSLKDALATPVDSATRAFDLFVPEFNSLQLDRSCRSANCI
jgi:hypothetical protein